MGIFPGAQGQLTPQCDVWSGRILEPIPDLMVALVTCKNEEDSFKNKGARVVTTVFFDFSDTQGQLTL